jgi:hypothetical protein
MRNKKGEEKLYPLVQRYLRRRGYLTLPRKGGRVQADIVGIRDVGGRYSHEIEVVAVEVKNRKRTRLRYVTQALGYSKFAHRCYLAMPARYGEEEVRYARQMGVGLLQIGGKKIREVLSAETKIPTETELTGLLRRFGFVKCIFCGSIVRRSQATRINRINAFGEEKHLYLCKSCKKYLQLQVTGVV